MSRCGGVHLTPTCHVISADVPRSSYYGLNRKAVMVNDRAIHGRSSRVLSSHCASVATLTRAVLPDAIRHIMAYLCLSMFLSPLPAHSSSTHNYLHPPSNPHHLNPHHLQCLESTSTSPSACSPLPPPQHTLTIRSPHHMAP